MSLWSNGSAATRSYGMSGACNPFCGSSLQIRSGEQSGHFEIAVPRSFFESADDSYDPPEIRPTYPSQVDIARNARLLEDAEVELEVLLEGPRISFRE